MIEELGPLLEIDEDYFTHYVYVFLPWDSLIGILETRDLVLVRRSTPLAYIIGSGPLGRGQYTVRRPQDCTYSEAVGSDSDSNRNGMELLM